MDLEMQQVLAALLRRQTTAALGTLDSQGPMVTMILYAEQPDFHSFYFHISQLALHTKNIVVDPRVCLLISDEAGGSKNPQAMARISLRGIAEAVAPSDPGYQEAKAVYLRKHPKAAFNFELSDFTIYRVKPQTARFVAGFGKIFDLAAQDIQDIAATTGMR